MIFDAVRKVLKEMLSNTIANGRLVKDPVLRQKSKKGRIIKWAYYRIAIGQDESDRTDFLNCVAFGRQAEFVRQYMKQGTEVLVVGRLRNYEYTDDVGNQIPALQLLVKVQGVCGKWIEGSDAAPERVFSHAQDFPMIAPGDLDALEKSLNIMK